MVLLYYNNSHSSQKVHGILFLFINVLYTFHLLRVVIAGAAYPLSRIVIFVIGVTIDPVPVLVVQAGQAAGRLLAVAEDTLVDDAGEVSVFIIFIQFFLRENLVGRIDKEHILMLRFGHSALVVVFVDCISLHFPVLVVLFGFRQ